MFLSGRQLGAGAFGRVVKAEVYNLEEENTRTIVALKMAKSTADSSHLRSLVLELKILIHLGKHLNIVNLMGAYTVNIGKGTKYINLLIKLNTKNEIIFNYELDM